ncbi:MAG: hypothetical protein HGB12_07105 [Bacteroidetes bacterium]|nr:hypothetical protein [Bacteroidota bacterium]
MKKKILFLFLFLPFVVKAQQNASRHDTLILDKFFNLVGKGIKKTYEKIQKDTIKQNSKLGFSFAYLTYSNNDFFGEEYYIPSITFNYRKSCFSLGPILYPDGNKITDFSYPGIQFIYQINPFKEHKFLNFYFQYSLGYYREKNDWTYKDLDWPDTNYIDVREHDLNISIDNMIGYGIKLKICKGLYIYQNFSMGIVWQNRKYKSEFPNKIRSGNNTDTERANLFIAGLGYRF